MTLAHARALLENLVLEVVLFFEFKAKVSIIQVPNHSPSLGSSSIYDGNGSVNVTQKAVGMLAYIPSRSICQILANFSGVEF